MSLVRHLSLVLVLGVAIGVFVPTLLSTLHRVRVTERERERSASATAAAVVVQHNAAAAQHCPDCTARCAAAAPLCPPQPAISCPPPAPCPACPAPPLPAPPITCPTPPPPPPPLPPLASLSVADSATCKQLFAKHNVEGDSACSLPHSLSILCLLLTARNVFVPNACADMKEQLELDGLLGLVRLYCGHREGVQPGLVDFPETQPHTTILDVGSNKG
jgi:hypothetical protein